ncbi:MAG TPA: hypothetical protein VG328_23580 [Stellaceae bacterium]|nr:hypothetical protein [Stellaceae bacterium]
MEGSSMRFGFIAVPAFVLLSATAMAQSTVVIAPSAPPTVREEIIPPAPSTDVVWQPGHWAWTGSQYTWVSGVYVARPRPQVAWVPGHWDRGSNGWTWVDGYWQ